jgi:DedD protein
MTDPNDIHTPDSARGAPSDLDRMRRQARQRFVGAVALVLVAVIALPFLLDSQPRPVSPNIVIDIPKAEAVAPVTPASAPLAFVVSASAPVPATPDLAPNATPDATPDAIPDPTPAAAPSTHAYAVQAGSYSEASKLREVQAKLDRAGLKHYTQTAHGKDGTAYTRVRLGPFATQSEANAAAARLTKLGIKSMVIKPS